VNERHVDEAIEEAEIKRMQKTGFWSPYTWKVLAKVTGTSDKTTSRRRINSRPPKYMTSTSKSARRKDLTLSHLIVPEDI